jgi:hypothetical protein
VAGGQPKATPTENSWQKLLNCRLWRRQRVYSENNTTPQGGDFPTVQRATSTNRISGMT